MKLAAGVKAGRHRSYLRCGVRSDPISSHYVFLILPQRGVGGGRGGGQGGVPPLSWGGSETPGSDSGETSGGRAADGDAADDRFQPFIEEKIIKQQSELKELSKGYYDLKENQQVDELVTGIILKHNLFPVNLSISEKHPGIPCLIFWLPPRHLRRMCSPPKRN